MSLHKNVNLNLRKFLSGYNEENVGVGCLLSKLPFRILTSPGRDSVGAVELDEIFSMVCSVDIER